MPSRRGRIEVRQKTLPWVPVPSERFLVDSLTAGRCAFADFVGGFDLLGLDYDPAAEQSRRAIS